MEWGDTRSSIEVISFIACGRSPMDMVARVPPKEEMGVSFL